MKKAVLWSLTLSTILVGTSASAAPLSEADRAKIASFVAQDAATTTGNGLAIWKFAEPGFKETKSSALLQDTLRKAGFTVKGAVAGMPTAFVASYRTGPGPVIAILAEFDALPGLSQQADKTNAASIPGQGSGHGCGHNLLGAGSVGGAIAVRKWMQQANFKGEIRVYGAPAEEGGDGKAYLVRAGLFKDVDIALHWHPTNENGVWNMSSQANIKTEFSFHGIATHAAASPDKGRSALEGIELMDVAVGFLRQRIPDGTRIHGVVTNGGGAPNVTPALAQSLYYVRNVDPDVVRALQTRMTKAAEGAAIATGTKVDWEVIGGTYPLLINKTLNKLMYGKLEEGLQQLEWTPTEVTTAKAIQQSLGLTTSGTDLHHAQPLEPKTSWQPGSTDVGDVSYVVPTAGFTIAAWPADTPAHSWASTAASGSSYGLKTTVIAAGILANTAVELMLNPDVIADAKAELKMSQGNNFSYSAMFGDRAPALNYTDSSVAAALR